MWRITQQDINGWTLFPESPSILSIFVNQKTGSDTNPGTQDKPVKTLKKGWSLRVKERQFKMSLARGQVWDEGFAFTAFNLASPEAPTIITSYGSEIIPPRIISPRISLQPAGTTANYIVFAHINFQGNFTEQGISHVARSGLWVEGCWIHGYHTGIVFQAADSETAECKDLIIRRNCIYDCYGPGKSGHPQGFYVMGVRDTFVVEGNTLDHNGWQKVGDDDMYNHNMYINGYNDPVTMTGNVSARASSHGAQLRSGGKLTKHLSIDNAIHVSYGLARGGGPQHAGGIQDGIISDVVLLGGRKINGGVQAGNRGWGFEFANIDLCTCTRIFIADENIGDGGGPGIKLEAAGIDDVRKEAVGILDLEITNLAIRNWALGLEVQDGMGTGQPKYSNQVIKKVVIIDSSDLATKNAKAVQIIDPKTYPENNRTLKTYLEYLKIDPGPDPTDTFLSQCKIQQINNWRKEFTAEAAIAYLVAPFGWSKDTTPMPITAQTVFTDRNGDNLGTVGGVIYSAVAIQVIPTGAVKPSVIFNLNGVITTENSAPYCWPADDGKPVPKELAPGSYVLKITVIDLANPTNKLDQTFSFQVKSITSPTPTPVTPPSPILKQTVTILGLQASSSVLQLKVARSLVTGNVAAESAIDAAINQTAAVAALVEKIQGLI